jgi:hypothetical protein
VLFVVTGIQNLQILMSLGLWLFSNSRIHLNAVYSHCPQKILWQLLFAFGLITNQKERYISNKSTYIYIYHNINCVQSSFLQDQITSIKMARSTTTLVRYPRTRPTTPRATDDDPMSTSICQAPARP